MSAYTTIEVSREKARMYLIRRAMSMPDAEIEDALDRALDHRLYNVRIVGNDRGPDDDLLDYAG